MPSGLAREDYMLVVLAIVCGDGLGQCLAHSHCFDRLTLLCLACVCPKGELDKWRRLECLMGRCSQCGVKKLEFCLGYRPNEYWVYSDGCSSQFKGLRAMYFVARYPGLTGCIIRWNYFGSGHGKEVKRALQRMSCSILRTS